MRARFAFPMQVTGRDIAAAPESMPRADEAAPARPRARGRPRARWPPPRRTVGVCGTDLPGGADASAPYVRRPAAAP